MMLLVGSRLSLMPQRGNARQSNDRHAAVRSIFECQGRLGSGADSRMRSAIVPAAVLAPEICTTDPPTAPVPNIASVMI